jgi:arylsulfatase A-like enzyme
MRIITKIAVLFALAPMMSASVSASELPSKSGYNVIMISFDALQARHLKAYGYQLATTSYLDRFLSKAYLFKNALTPAPWTTPAHMSIFTSWYPSEHKVVNALVNSINIGQPDFVKANLKELSPSAVTLAQILKKNGYVTAGFTGDGGLKTDFGHAQGFDTFYDKTKFGGFDTSQPMAINWLEENRDKSFFLFLHGYDVHGMYDPPDGFDYRFVKKPYNGKYTGSSKEWNKLRYDGLASSEPIRFFDVDTAFWRAIYDEKISRADEYFGKMLEYIEKNGLMENSIIVVLSDHGTAFLEHGKFYHGNTLYGELTDVLLAFHVPGQEKGEQITSLVSTLDVAPTILSMLGIKDPAIDKMKGIDLTPAMKGKDVSRDIFLETDYLLYTHKRGIQTPDGWKMILTMENLKRELYNLKSDPGESVNLAEKEPGIAYKLEQQIYKHLKDMNASEGPWRIGCPPELGDKCKSI